MDECTKMDESRYEAMMEQLEQLLHRRLREDTEQHVGKLMKEVEEVIPRSAVGEPHKHTLLCLLKSANSHDGSLNTPACMCLITSNTDYFQG